MSISKCSSISTYLACQLVSVQQCGLCVQYCSVVPVGKPVCRYRFVQVWVAGAQCGDLYSYPCSCLYIIEFNRLAGQVHGYGDGALCHIFYSGLPDCIKDEISRVGKPCTLNGYHTLAQTIDARYWERKSEISCQTKTSSLSSTSNSKSSASSSDSKGKSKEKDNKSKGSDNKSKGSSSSSGTSKSTTPDAPSHLRKDGKLTEEEHQWCIKDKLCMFCGQPGHMVKDCPKSTSKSAKTKARAAKVETPTAAESKK